MLAHNVTRNRAAVAFGVDFVHAVISYKRKRLRYYLPAIARVGECFLIARHRGGEHYLTDCAALRSETAPLKYRAVRKHKRGFSFVLKNHLFSSDFSKSAEMF